MKQLFFSAALLFSAISFSQVGVGTTTPDASAQLDVTSTSKGFLPPRLTMAQMNSIPTPANGLIVYCSDCAPLGLYTYISPSWSSFLVQPTASVTEINIEAEIAAGASSSIFADGATGERDNNEKRLRYTNLAGATPNKINWYFYRPSTNVTVAQLKSIYYIASKTGKNTPYIFVYTKPTGAGDLGTWYRSRFTYGRDPSTTEVGFNQFYAIAKSNVEASLPGLALTRNALSVDKTTPDYLNENILFIGIGTDSSSAAGNYDFSLQEMGIENVSGAKDVFRFTLKQM